MITYYFKSIRSKKLEEKESYQKGSWIHVERPSSEEVDFLADTFKLDTDLLRDALDEDEMPRLEKDSDNLYMYVRVAYAKAHGEFDTIPLLIIHGPEFVVTVSLRKLVTFDAFFKQKFDFTTTQRTKLTLQILHEVVEQYDRYITATSKQIKAIRMRLRGHEIRNKDFVDFVTIEDALNDFLAALLPANATLRRLSLGRNLPLFEEDQDIIEDLLLSNEQSIEACRSNIKSIINIRQAYSSISSNNLNRTIKILTVATVMISLPNIFFSMYGMNVELPFQDHVLAFVGITSIVALVLLLAYTILRRKKII